MDNLTWQDKIVHFYKLKIQLLIDLLLSNQTDFLSEYTTLWTLQDEPLGL